MAFDWSARRATATNLITKYGCSAVLRRADGDRGCIVFYEPYTRPHPGELRNAAEGLAMIAADGLDVAPDAEKDHLVLIDPATGDETENLRLISPVGKYGPGGVVVYWEMQARRR